MVKEGEYSYSSTQEYVREKENEISQEGNSISHLFLSEDIGEVT